MLAHSPLVKVLAMTSLLLVTSASKTIKFELLCFGAAEPRSQSPYSLAHSQMQHHFGESTVTPIDNDFHVQGETLIAGGSFGAASTVAVEFTGSPEIAGGAVTLPDTSFANNECAFYYNPAGNVTHPPDLLQGIIVPFGGSFNLTGGGSCVVISLQCQCSTAPCSRSQATDPCESSPCVNSGTCRVQGSDFFCECTALFSGTTCAQLVLQSDTSTNINTATQSSCVSQPCLNRGLCVSNNDILGEYACVCSAGTTGELCQTTISTSCGLSGTYITLTSVAQIQSLRSCTSLMGSLMITITDPVLISVSLPLLSVIYGDFLVADNAQLQSIRMLSLVEVFGTVSFQDNARLSQIHVPVLKNVGGLTFAANSALRSLAPESFAFFETVTGNLKITSNQALRNIDVLAERLASTTSAGGVTGAISIVDNTQLCQEHTLTTFAGVPTSLLSVLENAPAQSAVCLVQTLQDLLSSSTISNTTTTRVSEATAQHLGATLVNATRSNAWLEVEDSTYAATTIMDVLSLLIDYVDTSTSLNTSVQAFILSSLENIWSDESLARLHAAGVIPTSTLSDLVETFSYSLSRTHTCGDPPASAATQTLFVQSGLELGPGASKGGLYSRSDMDTSDTSILVPSEFGASLLAAGAPGFNGSTCYRAHFVVYERSAFFSTSPNEQRVNSAVISFGVQTSPQSVELVQNATVLVRLPHHEELSDGTITQCVSWSHLTESWVDDGCALVANESSTTLSLCKCTHLTNFAVLLDARFVTDTSQTLLVVFSYVGCILSMVGAALLLLTYTVLKALRTPQMIIIMNLCVAIFFTNLVFLVGLDRTGNTSACRTSAFFLYFFLLAQFCWTLCFSHQLYKLLVRVQMVNVSRTRSYFAFAWLVPLTVALVAVIVDSISNRALQLGSDSRCWFDSRGGLIGFFVIPVALLLTLNICIFVLTIRSLRTAAQSRSSLKATTSKDKKRMFVYIVAFFVTLGLTWSFGFAALASGLFGFWYPFVVFNASQGALLFVVFCCKKTVYVAWLERLGCGSNKRHNHKKVGSKSSGARTLSSGSTNTASKPSVRTAGSTRVSFSLEEAVSNLDNLHEEHHDVFLNDVPPSLDVDEIMDTGKLPSGLARLDVSVRRLSEQTLSILESDQETRL